MFDFRYHVASLAAVFLALVIGILIGIGLSGRGFIDDVERENLNEKIAELLSMSPERSARDHGGRRRRAVGDGERPTISGARSRPAAGQE